MPMVSCPGEGVVSRNVSTRRGKMRGSCPEKSGHGGGQNEGVMSGHGGAK